MRSRLDKPIIGVRWKTSNGFSRDILTTQSFGFGFAFSKAYFILIKAACCLKPFNDCFTEAKLRCNSGAQRLVGTTPTHPELGGEITERKKGPARGTLWNLFPSARVKKDSPFILHKY